MLLGHHRPVYKNVKSAPGPSESESEDSPSGRGKCVTPNDTHVTRSVLRIDLPPSRVIQPSSESAGASIDWVGNFPALGEG